MGGAGGRENDFSPKKDGVGRDKSRDGGRGGQVGGGGGGGG